MILHLHGSPSNAQRFANSSARSFYLFPLWSFTHANVGHVLNLAIVSLIA